MRGILSGSGYLPHYRLDRSQITAFLGTGGGKGKRAVASFDEDTTTMGFEAARRCLRASDTVPDSVLFATVTPAYADRTNATTIHAALRLPTSVAAIDMNGSVRSTSGGLRLALKSTAATLVVGSDARGGFPTSGDEASGGDGAAAVLIGSDTDGTLLAEHLASATCTDEFVDRWRSPGDARSKLWEERFGEVKYLECGQRAWAEALAATGLAPGDVTTVAISGLHGRATKALAGRLKPQATLPDRADAVGNSGAAQPIMLLVDALEQATPGDVIALIVLSDGADVFLFRATEVVASWKSERTVAAQASSGQDLPYGKFLSWRGGITVEPPRRPEPARASSSAADRNEAWKFGFVANRDTANGEISLPPSRMSESGGSGGLEPVPMADVLGTIATFTVDRLAYSPSPPIAFGIVDFDGGGRFPIELTDVRPEDVKIGGRVEMTFRRLASSDGIHNYFWKARPVAASGDTPTAGAN